MDDFMKTEAKDIISTAIEKASGATGINVEVRLSILQNNLFHEMLTVSTHYSLPASSLRTAWIVSSVLAGTVLWEKASPSK